MVVIFFSVGIGSGHDKAAEAIQEAVLFKYPHAKTKVIDTLRYIHPVLDRVVVKSYFNTLKTTPSIIKKIYELTNETNESMQISKKFNRLLAFRMKKLFSEHQPDIVVCTHPFALQMMHSLKKRRKILVPVVGVITDYSAHGFWIEKYIDAYIVANEEVKAELIAKQIPKQTVHAIGIPVVSKFRKNMDIEKFKISFQLNNQMTALVMGGGLGLGQLEEMVKNLIKISHPLQIIVVTGNNNQLKQALEQIIVPKHVHLIILGYTENVAEFMSVADFIITKPGGITVTEALVKRLPIVVISPIPGHEEKNARFLLNAGLAICLFEDQQIQDLILNTFIHRPARLEQIKILIEEHRKPEAAFNALQVIEQLIEQGQEAIS